MSFEARRLFQAVVISGAALAGCGPRTTPPPPTSNTGPESPPPDAAAPVDATPCPEGSELPMPPCYYIR